VLWNKKNEGWRIILHTLSSERSKRPSAEVRFRAAFERLKVNSPERLLWGTPVSQNNVAKEAGCDPSALKKSRFPTLVAEIQHWVESHQEDRQPSARKQLQKKQMRNRSARETVADFRRQRDAVVGLLADANLRIVELTEELASAKAELEERVASAPVISLTRREDLRIYAGKSEDRGGKSGSRDAGDASE
jgi:hypothetical protein